MPACRPDATQKSGSGGVADLLRIGAAVELPAAVGWAAAQARGDDLAESIPVQVGLLLAVPRLAIALVAPSVATELGKVVESGLLTREDRAMGLVGG